MDHCVMETPAGALCIWEIRGCITESAWVTAPLRAPETPLLQEAARQVGAYFKGERRAFDLPIAAPGTPLEQRVWEAVLRIPYGRTVTSRALAERLGQKRQVRAVIAACTKNPVALFVPCHRVTAENGEGTYVGGPEIRRILWAVEGIADKFITK